MDDLPLLSEDLLNELDCMDNAILPSKKKKKKGKRGVPDGAVEIAKKRTCLLSGKQLNRKVM